MKLAEVIKPLKPKSGIDIEADQIQQAATALTQRRQALKIKKAKSTIQQAQEQTVLITGTRGLA